MISLSARDIVELLPPAAAVAAVEAAVRVDAARECIVPQRLHVEWQGNTFLTMPAANREVAGVKMPFRFTVSWLDGKENFELTEIQPNVAIDAARFARPK